MIFSKSTARGTLIYWFAVNFNASCFGSRGNSIGKKPKDTNSLQLFMFTNMICCSKLPQ